MKHAAHGDWHLENHTEGYSVSWRIRSVLHQETTPYQDLKIVDTLQWGRALILDDCVQTTETEEFIYHEMMAHVLLNAHPRPRRVLVVGGGDGGVVREVIKYPQVERVDLVEIDNQVVEACRKYLPGIACGLEDPRVKVNIMDGVLFVAGAADASYDVVIVDSSDPLGPAEVLFNESFYKELFRILDQDGLMVTQAESPLIYPTVFQGICRGIKQVFGAVHVYLTPVPTYVGGPWAFAAGTKQYDPRTIHDDSRVPDGLKYYNSELHRAVFALPQFVKEMIA